MMMMLLLLLIRSCAIKKTRWISGSL